MLFLLPFFPPFFWVEVDANKCYHNLEHISQNQLMLLSFLTLSDKRLEK